MPIASNMISSGRQNCSDLHSWGPGIRNCYILHYIIKGKGTFINGNKSYAVSSGESFVIRPFDNIMYFPDESALGSILGSILREKNMFRCLTV